MSRIKKRGLDYFPMDADFTRKPHIRRIMKKEGEGAAIVLVDVLCAIYSGEGYYVEAGELFYDDLASGYYERTATDVERIVRLAVEYGLFDARLFASQSILTSADIQQQFLHSTRRRVSTPLRADYSLVSQAEANPAVASPMPQAPVEPVVQTVVQSVTPTVVQSVTPTVVQSVTSTVVQSATSMPQNVTGKPHSIAQQSIAQQSIAQQSINTPLQVPPRGKADEEEETFASPQESVHPPVGAKQWTIAAIDALRPPADNLPRNFDGLLQSLRQFRISPAEQYAIIRRSNFGVIGHPIWKGFCTLRDSGGKIKLPGRYLLSLR